MAKSPVSKLLTTEVLEACQQLRVQGSHNIRLDSGASSTKVASELEVAVNAAIEGKKFSVNAGPQMYVITRNK